MGVYWLLSVIDKFGRLFCLYWAVSFLFLGRGLSYVKEEIQENF